jgi:hypothetical protein
MGKIPELLGYDVGDIITLKDIQTLLEFNELSVDFTIIETRQYIHPEGIFAYTGYIASYQAPSDDEEQKIMLLIRKVGSSFDLQLHFMDNEGPSEGFEGIFIDGDDDMAERFIADLHFEDLDKPLEVTWDRQGTTNFGIGVTSSESEEESGCKSIAEYFTNDETRGNPNCFIEWTGDKVGGYIEIWYGCDLQERDVEIHHINQD